MNLKNKIFLSYVLAIFTVVTVIYYTSFYEENVLVCGVVDYESQIPEKLKEGKKLFKVLCASCHKVDKLVSGVDLRDFKKDSIQFYNIVINNDIHKIDFSHLEIEQTTQMFEFIKAQK